MRADGPAWLGDAIWVPRPRTFVWNACGVRLTLMEGLGGGFSQVDPAVAWLKLKSLSEGAELASAEL